MAWNSNSTDCFQAEDAIRNCRKCPVRLRDCQYLVFSIKINKLPRVKNPRFSPIKSFGFGLNSELPRKYVSPSLHPPPNIQFLAGFSRSENKKKARNFEL